MTQKELAYVEDAIGHEKIITDMCDVIIENLSDENLISFMNSQKEDHELLCEKLMNLLEEKSNE